MAYVHGTFLAPSEETELTSHKLKSALSYPQNSLNSLLSTFSCRMRLSNHQHILSVLLGSLEECFCLSHAPRFSLLQLTSNPRLEPLIPLLLQQPPHLVSKCMRT